MVSLEGLFCSARRVRVPYSPVKELFFDARWLNLSLSRSLVNPSGEDFVFLLVPLQGWRGLFSCLKERLDNIDSISLLSTLFQIFM
jgi:hypothetical protein